MPYQVTRAGSKRDAKKIDVIATKQTEIIYVQVKLGAISERDISEVVPSVKSLPADAEKTTKVAFVAGKYPLNHEFHRANLEKKHSIQILCVSSADVLASNPEYRRALGGDNV